MEELEPLTGTATDRGTVSSTGTGLTARSDGDKDGDKDRDRDRDGDIEMQSNIGNNEGGEDRAEDAEGGRGIANNSRTLNNSGETVETEKMTMQIRTEPIQGFLERRRKLERLEALKMPEIHYVGEIVSAHGIIKDASEGAFIRFKIDYGKAWEHLEGDLVGQTHVSYCHARSSEYLTFNHPIDVHFAEAGMQGWGGPRLSAQAYRFDWCGRKVLGGYGFAHLPASPGTHRIEIPLWRPTGTSEQELTAYLLGITPSLVTHDPIYQSAWKERCRLVTVAAGKVVVDLFVVARNLKFHGIDQQYI